MNESALVTGARGFLGRHAARALAAAGYRVIGLGHGPWLAHEWRTWGLDRWEESEVCLDALRKHAGQPDIILHCAGSGSVDFSAQQPLLSLKNTVTTTADVLDFVRLFSPASRVVFLSSASVYGEARSLPIKESAPTKPLSEYGSQKLQAELCMQAAGREGISTAVVRLFSVYGCGLRKQLMWDACRKLAANDPVFQGSGDELRDWLHVEDAASLMLAASRHAQSSCPIVNGGTGVGVSVREIVTCLGARLLKASFTPVFSGVHRPGNPRNYVADLQGSAQWGWAPSRNWQQGVEEYAEWWLSSEDRR